MADKEDKVIDCDIPNAGSGATGEITRLVRYALLALGGYLIGKGWIEQDTLNAAVAIGTTATPVVVGVIIGRMNQKKLVKAVEIAKTKTSGEG